MAGRINFWILSQLLFLQGGNCPVCKNKLVGKRFHVHHIDKNTENNSIQNLMILHPPCHRCFHGRGNNIESEQVEIDFPCETCEKAKLRILDRIDSLIEATRSGNILDKTLIYPLNIFEIAHLLEMNVDTKVKELLKAFAHRNPEYFTKEFMEGKLDGELEKLKQ